VDKYNCGTYKNKVIHRWGMTLTLCQCGKKVGDVDNFTPVFFGFVRMSGTRYDGDNPSPPLLGYIILTQNNTFPHRFTAGYSEKTTFSPL